MTECAVEQKRQQRVEAPGLLLDRDLEFPRFLKNLCLHAQDSLELTFEFANLREFQLRRLPVKLVAEHFAHDESPFEHALISCLRIVPVANCERSKYFRNS